MKNRKYYKIFIIDFLMLNLSFFLVYMLKIRNFPSKEVFSPFNLKVFFVSIILINLLWLIFFFLFHKKMNLLERLEEHSTIFRGVLFGSILIFVYIFAKKPSIDSLSWEMLFSYWFATYMLVFAGKLFIHKIQKKLYLRTEITNAIIVGKPYKIKGILDIIENFPFLNYKIHYTTDISQKSTDLTKEFTKLERVINEHKIDELIVVLENSDIELIEKLYTFSQKKKISLSLGSDLYKHISGLAKITSIPGLPLIKVNPEILSNGEKFLKRTIDIIFSALVLILLSPLFILISLAIKFTSRGTVFYKQKRMKSMNEEFYIYKFRTMVMNAETKTGPKWADKNDSRITLVGKFLRKYWLDELPQFINVLIGDMSIVGPRPERLHFVKILEQEIPYYRRRLLVKPGITGWAQVKHKYDESIEDVHAKILFDFFYIQNLSIWLDLKIIFLTVYMILFGKGHK